MSPYLKNKKFSNQHKDAIIKFSNIKNAYCKNDSLFLFPWSSILYNILDARNVTRFDVPNLDMITEKEGNRYLIPEINSPCLTIVQEKSLSKMVRLHLSSKGMRKVEEF